MASAAKGGGTKMADGVGAGLPDRLLDGVEDGHLPLEARAAAARGDAGHDLGAVGQHLLGVEAAGRAGDALDEDAGVLDRRGCSWCSSRLGLDRPGAATAFRAASPRSSAAMMSRPLLARISLPSSTLVPSRRTTSGIVSPTCRAAATMPLAMTSHFMMPPKMLTSTAFTLGSERMILKAVGDLLLVGAAAHVEEVGRRARRRA